jgi:predicted dehydrogenase
MHRRDFLRNSSAAALSAGIAHSILGVAAPRASQEIRVGVIGCGGRGTGAAADALRAHPYTRVVAMADLLPERLSASLGHLEAEEEFGGRVAVGGADGYSGFDAYRRLVERRDVDAVLIAGPPGFRPMQVEAAIAAGKHVFMEKPVAVDPVGVRRVIAAAEEADRRKLSIVAGTQRRHERSYLEAMRRIADGAIGRICAARCYWNQGGLWVHPRRPEYSDMEWQCRNWLYFTWLSGDHIVEQHIHNLDVINWALGATPTGCTGVGGRQARTGPEYGNIYDHFGLEYEYPEGVSVLSMCRQIDGCPSRVEEVIVGSEGTCTMRPGFARIEGRQPWRFEGLNPNPYQEEQAALFSAIAEGRQINEGRRVAESTLTAILGRMAAYTGQSVTWAQARDSTLDLMPQRLAFGDLPVAEVSVPGRTPLH